VADRSDTFLQLLQTGGGADHALAAEQVNAFAPVLGLAERDLVDMIGRLQEDGLVTVRWGGELRLTAKGSARAVGKADAAASVSIGDIGAGANVNINSPNAVVGAGAMRIDLPSRDLADRSVAALREAGQALQGPQQEKTKQLADSVESIVGEAAKAPQDPSALKVRLTEVKGLVGDLSDIAEKGSSLWPALIGAKTVLGLVARAVGIPWSF
jgi:hypothetical protein